MFKDNSVFSVKTTMSSKNVAVFIALSAFYVLKEWWALLLFSGLYDIFDYPALIHL